MTPITQVRTPYTVTSALQCSRMFGKATIRRCSPTDCPPLIQLRFRYCRLTSSLCAHPFSNITVNDSTSKLSLCVHLVSQGCTAAECVPDRLRKIVFHGRRGQWTSRSRHHPACLCGYLQNARIRPTPRHEGRPHFSPTQRGMLCNMEDGHHSMQNEHSSTTHKQHLLPTARPCMPPPAIFDFCASQQARDFCWDVQCSIGHQGCTALPCARSGARGQRLGQTGSSIGHRGFWF